MIQFTDELNNHLVEQAAARANFFNLSKKKEIECQHDLFVGAITTLDFLNGQIGIEGGKSSCPPSVYLSILRGEFIKKREVNNG